LKKFLECEGAIALQSETEEANAHAPCVLAFFNLYVFHALNFRLPDYGAN